MSNEIPGASLQRLAEFLPTFEDPDFVFGEWIQPRPREDGVLAMGYVSYGEEASRFEHVAYELGFIRGDFDWPEWAQTPEAKRLRDDPTALSEASADDVAKLLTVLIRQDRFAEGALLSAYESGLLTSILRRVDALARASAS